MKTAILSVMMLRWIHHSVAFSPALKSRTIAVSSRLLSSLTTDDEGRTIRRKSAESSSSSSSWDDFDPWDDSTPKQQNNNNNDNGWDDFDPLDDRPPARQPRKPSGGNRGGRGDDRRGRGDDRRGGRSKGGGNWDSRPNKGGGNWDSRPNKGSFRGGRRDNRQEKTPADKKINMKALEGAGFVHLYGLASCVNALQANRRDFSRPEDFINLEDLEGEDLKHEKEQRERKPEAQYSPHLFIQESSGRRQTRSYDKAQSAERLEELAQERKIPIARVDKGVLNTLSGNRPHQGYVLRCGQLEWEPLSKLPADEKKLWLCLDEVVDPQNLGALLRSAYFLESSEIGVVVCAKNSAPPSPVVSAASAGALEVANVYSTSNLPRLLSQAKESGFRILGASTSVPSSVDDAQVYNLVDLPEGSDTPTVLVLGSEGHGLRTLVAKACTDFVCIPGGAGQVDSLNVSVTGGILLWQLLNSMK